MAGITHKGYALHYARKNAVKKQIELAQPKPTPEEFWDAAYQYDPQNEPEGSVSEFRKIMIMSNLETIPLGFYGAEQNARFDLMPAIAALPTTEDVEGLTSLELAGTALRAISYPDGHPSEYEDSVRNIKSEEDIVLRRFVCLGWVIHVTKESWQRTGHVLVMVMDEGRDRHPWIVLASHWPSEFEDVEGRFTTYAEVNGQRDDPSQPGLLPGGRNRTSVAKIVPFNKAADKGGPVLKQIGPDFNFLVEPFSSYDSYDSIKVSRGPDLARIMEWYWDPEKQLEVCFYENGQVSMTFNRETKRYTHCNTPDA